MLKTVSTANGLVSPTFSGNVTLSTGNLVQGTAGKGVNFTANTPATGMTSQLLSWYEEGAYTPTISAASGTITTSSGSSTYTRVGTQVTVTFDITITDNGTGGGILYLTLPFTSSAPAGGMAREYFAAGFSVTVSIVSGQTTLNLVKTSNDLYPGDSGYKIRGSITYRC